MLQKIDKKMFLGNGPIKILYPGLAVAQHETGIGSIGRIDHAVFHGNTIIRMHPHINDEILSYFRTGNAEHSDSEGFVKTIGGNTLMLMKAGKLFYHEEKIIGEPTPLEGLQIFIRPGKKDLTPQVVFHEFETYHSEHNWRNLASPFENTPFQFSSQTWIYDRLLTKDECAGLPELQKENLTCLLYVFKGNVLINSAMKLEKMESLIIKDENISIEAADTDAELVLFITDEAAEIYAEGMFSGNKATI